MNQFNFTEQNISDLRTFNIIILSINSSVIDSALLTSLNSFSYYVQLFVRVFQTLQPSVNVFETLQTAVDVFQTPQPFINVFETLQAVVDVFQTLQPFIETFKLLRIFIEASVEAFELL